MNITLYIKMEGYDDGDFDVSDNYYASDKDFFDAMDRENKKKERNKRHRNILK